MRRLRITCGNPEWLGSVLTALFSALFLLFSPIAHAADRPVIPGVISYDGYLLDANSNPITAYVPMQFVLYSAAMGGQELWSESTNVSVDKGSFTVILGSSSPLSAAVFSKSSEVYLDVAIGGVSLTPRRRLASHAYAYMCENVVGTANVTTVAINGIKVIDEQGEWVGGMTQIRAVVQPLIDAAVADVSSSGADGVSCWDLNGNGACNASEDTNSDNVCDAYDCQGDISAFNLEQLGNVTSTPCANNEILKFDTGTSKWVCATVVGIVSGSTVALGAGSTIGGNTILDSSTQVASSNIQNGSVTGGSSGDIAPSTITGSNLAPDIAVATTGSITAPQFRTPVSNSGVAFIINQQDSNATDLMSFRFDGTEKASIDKDGVITGANISGSTMNTGDQTVGLVGDVTATAGGGPAISLTTSIASGAVTGAKIATGTITADKLASGIAIDTSGTLSSSASVTSPLFTNPPGGGTARINATTGGTDKMSFTFGPASGAGTEVATLDASGNLVVQGTITASNFSGGGGGGGAVTLTGDVTGTGTGTVPTTISSDAVTNSTILDGAVSNAKIANGTINLATKTTGNYVATAAASGTNITVSPNTGNGAAVVIGISNNPAFSASVSSPLFQTPASNSSNPLVLNQQDNSAARIVEFKFDGAAANAYIDASGNMIAANLVSGATLSGSNTGDLTLGTANGLSLLAQVLSLQAADSTHTGALTSTDWNTFNGKQDAGNYITALTGDVTAAGPGSSAATIANGAVTGPKLASNIAISTSGAISTTATVTAPALHTPVVNSGAALILDQKDATADNIVEFKFDGDTAAAYVDKDGNLVAANFPLGTVLTGANTGDQTITLTGDVTGSGSGSFATTIAAGAINSSKIFDGSIVKADIGATYVENLSAGTNISVGGSAGVGWTGTIGTVANPTFSTSVTSPLFQTPSSNGSNPFVVNQQDNSAARIVEFKFDGGTANAYVDAAGNLIGANLPVGAALSGSNTGDQTITLTGDITGSGTGSFATTIGTGAVTGAKILDGTVQSADIGANYVATTGAGTNISVSGSGGSNAAVTINTVNNPSFSTSVTSPLFQSPSSNSGAALIVNQQDATATSIMSFRFDGVEKASIDLDGNLIAPNLSGINSGDVTLGTANGLSLSGQALSLQVSDATHTGALTSADWSTFNGKQAAGSYITALTGDVTAAGPGSSAATIANGAITSSKLAANIAITGTVTSPVFRTPASNSGAALILDQKDTTADNIVEFKFDGAAAAAYVDKDGNLVGANFPVGASMSGTNTGDQTISLTGDISGSGTGSFAATIGTGAVTGAKILDGTIQSADIGANYVATAGAGTNISVSGSGGSNAAVTINTINNPSFSTSVTSPLFTNPPGGGTARINATTGGTDKMSFTFGSAGGAGTEVASLDSDGNLVLVGNITAANFSGGGGAAITLTGDVTGSGTGSVPTTIASSAITNGKIANSTIDLANKAATNYVATVGAGANISVSGSGSVNSAVSVGTVNNPNFSASVTSPLFQSPSNNGDAAFIINQQDADAANIVEFKFNGGTANAYVDAAGNLVATNFPVGASISGSNTGDVTLGTANGLSLIAQALSLQAADATHTGALNSADWSTFNGKQAAGSYITALTGDVTASGPGSSAATIANGAVTSSKLAANIAITGTVTSPVFRTPASNSGAALILDQKDTSADNIVEFKFDSASAAAYVDKDGNLVGANFPAGATISGSNTGDQTITLTGDITGSGTGSFATTIGTGAVTGAKILDGTIQSADIGANYVATAGAGTNISVSGSGGSNAAVTINTVNNPSFSISVTSPVVRTSASNSGAALVLDQKDTSADNIVEFKFDSAAAAAYVDKDGNLVGANFPVGASISGSNTGDVTLGTANGLSLIAQALSLQVADATHTGALTSADWSTFNGKQAAGSYITALTGDVTAAGPGSSAATIANGAVTSSKLAANIAITGTVTSPVVRTPASNSGAALILDQKDTSADNIVEFKFDSAAAAAYIDKDGNLVGANFPVGATISGSNTGDQTITLTGDVTGSGTGSFSATIGTGAVTGAKILDGTIQSADIGANYVATTGAGTNISVSGSGGSNAAVTINTVNNPNFSTSVTSPLFQTSSNNGDAAFIINQQDADAANIVEFKFTGGTANAYVDAAGNFVATNFPVGASISGSNTGDVTLGTANGLSLIAQALSLQVADATHTGALTSTDWNTFNSKQSAGSYITALTGDVTASGPGSSAATIANGAVTSSKLAANIAITGTVTSPVFRTPASNSGAALILDQKDTSADNIVEFKFDSAAAAAYVDKDGNLVGANFPVGATISGSNTGDQTITLTGDVTGSGTGSFAATIAANAIGSSEITDGSIQSGDIGANYVATAGAGTNISVSGSGGSNAAVTINTVNNPSFSTSVTSPLLQSPSNNGDAAFIINQQDADAANIVEFKFNGGTTNAYIDAAGNLVATNFPVGASISGGNTGDVTIGTANGLSLIAQALSLGVASTSTTGALTSTDWNTFNGKQAAGSYITALTGDVTAAGPGSSAATIANGAVTSSKLAANIAITGTVTSPVFRTPASNSGAALILDQKDTSADNIVEFKFDGAAAAAYVDKDGNLVGANFPVGASISGSNTGDQTITLTGDVTGSGTGSFAATIGTGAVTGAKILDGTIQSADIGANYVATAAAGTNISVSGSGGSNAAVTINTVNNPSFSTSVTSPLFQTPASNSGGPFVLNQQDNTATRIAEFKFDGGTAIAYIDAAGNLTAANFSPGATLSGTSSGTNTGDQTITLTGNVTGSGTGSFTTTIASGVVTSAMITNATIVGGDLAANIAISTTGNIATTGTGTVSSAASMAAPMFTRTTGANPSVMTINNPVSAGADKISFTFGVAGSGTEVASINEAGNIVATGTVTGTNLSGTNTGDQTITLTGNVTGSGTGSFATTIASGVVTSAMITDATIAGGDLAANIGISTTGNIATTSTGTLSSATSVTAPLFTKAAGGGTMTINDTSSAGADKISFTFGVAGSGTEVASISETGDIVATGTVTGSNLSGTHTGTSSGTNTGDQTITLTGNVTGSGTGSFATTIASGVVTSAMITDATIAGGDLAANIGISTTGNIATTGTGTLTSAASVTAPIFTRNTGANPSVMTINNPVSVGADKISFTFGVAGSGTEVASINEAGNIVATGTVTGTNLSGTNTGDQTITLTGNVTGSGTGSFATTIASGVVTSAMITDATIAGGDLAANIGISTTGNIATTGTGTVSSAASMAAPMFTRTTGANPSVMTINNPVSAGADKISFTFGVAGSGTEVASINEAGNIVATGTVTGSNLSGTHTGASSGTNTGDQTITLTGNVTGSGTGSFATTIASGVVTSAMITDATIAGGDLAANIGISTTGNIATTGTGTLTSAASVTAPIFTRNTGANPSVMTINNPVSAGADKISFTFGVAGSGTEVASINEAGNIVATGTVTGTNLSGTNTGNQTVQLTGDVTGGPSGGSAISVAGTIATGAVTSAKILDGTIAGGDLATNISISTTGNIATTGGNISVPDSTSSTVGTFRIGSTAYIANYGGASAFNTFFGGGAGNSSVTGTWNTALGHRVLENVASGSKNVGIGPFALVHITDGQDNVAIGSQAMQETLTGSSNVGIGKGALSFVTGDQNVAVGYQALLGLVGGSGNIAIGASAGGTYGTAESNNIVIGSIGTGGDSSVIRIGTDGTQTSAYISGIRNVTPGGTLIPVVVDSATGQLGVNSAGITSTQIADGTIAGGDLAANIGISTTGNIATTGTGTLASAASVTAPIFTRNTGANPSVMTINNPVSAGADKISFTFGVAGSGTEVASITEAGNIVATGTVTGSNLSGTHTGTSSGTNTGDQTITLTGDVTGSGTGSFVTTIAANAITGGEIATDAVALATKTTGNYVATVAAGTNMSVSGSGSENAAVTVNTIANPTFSTSVTTPTVSASASNLTLLASTNTFVLGNSASQLTVATTNNASVQFNAGSGSVRFASDIIAENDVDFALNGTGAFQTWAGNITTNMGSIKVTGTGCFGRTYVAGGAAGNGAAGGSRDGTDARCDAASAGSKLCTYEEMIESERCGSVSGVTGWINSPVGTDCQGWTSSNSGFSGAAWVSGVHFGTPCTTNQAFLCCK